MTRALLMLEDGEIFEGERFGADTDSLGEVIFNTGMSGYQEVITDPSYKGQIVTMTYPHIGNYGTNDEDPESVGPKISGLVIRDLPSTWSSWRGKTDLGRYLADHGIGGITEVDTRRLTRHIRHKGAMRGAISSTDLDSSSLLSKIKSYPEMDGRDLVAEVTGAEPYDWPAVGSARFRVAAFDFGLKRNILRSLAERGCATTVFPAHTGSKEIMASDPDGIFISNGPGDPAAVGYAVETISKLLGTKPMFGICLGHQLIALAAGMSTYKLPFGHHGVNHPVVRLEDQAIQITTQNHGFAVREAAFDYVPPKGPGDPLPRGVFAETPVGRAELTHINLNDYTIEGFALQDQRAFCVQYHPEAGPGPHDSGYLFEQFIKAMEVH